MRRAVVDTNIWVSALLNPAGAPAQVLEALDAGRFTLIVSEPLLAELADVLARPRIVRRYRTTQADGAALVSRLRRRAIAVPITDAIQLCRDPDDDLVIETALRGQADTLVTRDDDLKRDPQLIELLALAGVEVLSVRRFLAALDAEC